MLPPANLLGRTEFKAPWQPNDRQLPPTAQARAAQYVHMSTEHQKYSTENQDDAIQQYAARRGLTVIRTYADACRSRPRSVIWPRFGSCVAGEVSRSFHGFKLEVGQAVWHLTDAARERKWRSLYLDVRFGSRLCENHSADHLGAKLIQTARLTRIKYLLRLGLRFYRCVPTTASSVFTQPRSKTEAAGCLPDVCSTLASGHRLTLCLLIKPSGRIGDEGRRGEG
jgi:hypothetical protein